MKMKIDSGKMYLAVDPKGDRAREILGKPYEKAFLHRQTGDIVFFDRNGRRMDDWAGMGAAIDMDLDRATVEAAPEKWLEIPKASDRNLDAFIESFLCFNRIDAQLV
jgi:hypothetical protein